VGFIGLDCPNRNTKKEKLTMPNTHKQVMIEVNRRKADVDEGIADLIVELWKADIDTFMSCQDNRPKGYVWIQFASAYDGDAFLNIVAQNPELEGQTLYNRIHNRWDVIKKTWRYSIAVFDYGLIEDEGEDNTLEESHTGDVELRFTVSIRFPLSDYETVLSRMVEHNKSRKLEW
jgi:hypothetical protein